MSKPTCSLVRASILCVTLLFGMPAPTRGQECVQDAGSNYEAQGYVVNSIKIETPLDWLGPVKGKLDEIKSKLPLREGQPFKQDDLGASTLMVQNEIGRLDTTNSRKLDISVANRSFTNCDGSASPKKLDLVFRVYAVDIEFYRSLVYEGRKQGLVRVPVPTRLVKFLENFTPQPYVGFDRSRHLFAGSRATIKSDNPAIQKFYLDGGGSSSSALAEMGIEGSRDFTSGWLKHLEWRGDYQYSEMPSDTLRLKKGTVSVQFNGATRPFGGEEGDQALIVRFGASLEGGNRQSDAARNILTVQDPASARYGALKAYVGSSLRLGRHNLKASYGLQAGKTGEGLRLDYIKHIFDAAYSARFLPVENYPISIEAQFTAGRIDRRGGLVPIAERFFGGAAEQDFIPNDSWQIRNAPFIRSFPTNTLDQAGLATPVGGEGFISANLTVGVPVWVKPLVPREIRKEVVEAFDKKLVSDVLMVQLSLTYVPETKDYPKLFADAGFDNLEAVLGKISLKMEQLDTQNLTARARSKVNDAVSDVEDAQDSVDLAKENFSQKVEIVQPLHQLVFGFSNANTMQPSGTNSCQAAESVKKPMRPELCNVIKSLDELLKDKDTATGEKDPVLAAEQSNIEGLKSELQISFDKMYTAYVRFRTSRTGLLLAQEKAESDLRFVRSTIKNLVTEVNLASLGPVFMFDAARLRAGEPGRAGDFRYGIGAGVRAEFFGVGITFGYSFNPERRFDERRGSVVFAFDVSDLIR
ncbi:MAG: hypothetical protein WCF57_09525 [Pyrinomonadaceae bacterium]